MIDRYNMYIFFIYQKQLRKNKERYKNKVIFYTSSSPIVVYPFLLKNYHVTKNKSVKKSFKKHISFVIKNKLKTIIE